MNNKEKSLLKLEVDNKLLVIILKFLSIQEI